MSIKSYDTLRKIEKGKLDHASVILSGLRSNRSTLESSKRQLQESIAEESNDSIPGDPSLSLWLYQSFLKSAKEDLVSMDARITAVNEKIRETEQLVIQNYRHMRRFEIIIEQEQQRAKAERARQEENEIEDVVQSSYVRKDRASQGFA